MFVKEIGHSDTLAALKFGETRSACQFFSCMFLIEALT